MWVWSDGAPDPGGILAERPLPPLWVWSAGAPDPEGDPRGAPPCPPVGVERWRSRSWGGSSWSALCSPCGCGALALQILRAILVERPPSPPVVVGWLWGAGAPDSGGDPCQGAAAPLWLWSAGAPDPDRDPCHGAAAPPVVVERWRWRGPGAASSSAPLALGRLRRTRGAPGAPQERSTGVLAQSLGAHRPPPLRPYHWGGALNPEPGIIYPQGYMQSRTLILPPKIVRCVSDFERAVLLPVQQGCSLPAAQLLPSMGQT